MSYGSFLKFFLYFIFIAPFLFFSTPLLANEIIQKSLPGYLVLREGTGSDPIRYKKNAVYFNWANESYAFASDWPEEGMFLIKLSDPTISHIAENNLFGDEKYGFSQELSALDTNFDTKIDTSDDSWKSLYLWQDKNADAFIQTDELKALSDSSDNIINIDTEVANFEGKAFGFYAFSPLYDKINTRYDKDYKLDIDTLFLPILRGYGGLPDLHVAASENESLKSALIQLCALKAEEIFSTKYMTIRGDVERIMYLYAGVNNVDPKSRGPYIDARQLMILEKIMNKQFSGYVNRTGEDKSPNPNNVAAKSLQKAWSILLNKNTAALLVQCDAGKLFYPPIIYKIKEDSASLGMKQATSETINNITLLLTNKSEKDREVFWTMLDGFLSALDTNGVYAPGLLEALKNPPERK